MPRLRQHSDRVAVGLGLVSARVAQRNQLLCIGADVAGEQADQGADAELADQRLGHVTAADVRDLMRHDPGQRVGIADLVDRTGLKTTI